MSTTDNTRMARERGHTVTTVSETPVGRGLPLLPPCYLSEDVKETRVILALYPTGPDLPKDGVSGLKA